MATTGTTENEIMDLERESYRRFAAGDLEGLTDLFADDVLLFNPGTELLRGKQHELAALQEASKVDGLEMSWEATEARISKSEDMAWAHGTIRVKTPDGRLQLEKYLTVWMKVAGQWKLVAQVRNSNE